MYLATYWLAKDIHNYGQNYSYLKNNNRSKTINQKNPFYYQDLIIYIKTQNPRILNLKNETKIIYKDILQKESQNYATAGEIQWKNTFPCLDFSKIWKNIYLSYGPPHTTDTLYRLLHHSLKTNQYTYKCSGDKTNLSPNCDFCNKTEDLLHLFTTCNRIKNIWKHYQPILDKLSKSPCTPEHLILTLSTNNVNIKIKKLMLTLIQLMIYEITNMKKLT